MIDLFSIIGAFVSLIVAIIAIFATRRVSKKYEEFVKKPGDVISPQRAYVENKYYISSMPLTQDSGFFADANHILLDTSRDKNMLYRTKLPDFSFFDVSGRRLSLSKSQKVRKFHHGILTLKKTRKMTKSMTKLRWLLRMHAKKWGISSVGVMTN